MYLSGAGMTTFYDFAIFKMSAFSPGKAPP